MTAVPSSGTTAAEVCAEVRDEHHHVSWSDSYSACDACQNEYPCPTIRLVDAVEAVLALHRVRNNWGPGDDYCATCRVPWPCPTVCAITAAVTPTDRQDQP